MGETEIEVPRDRQASFESIISATIDDIYGFKLSAEQISKITNYVLDEQQSWQNRTLDKARLRDERMCFFDELKARGVQEIGFISMDGVSELEEGAKAIFPEVVVQRCIVSQFAKIRPDARLQRLPAHFEFERFCQVWTKYPGVVAVWKRCFAYVEQLFDYPSIKLLYLRVVELKKMGISPCC